MNNKEIYKMDEEMDEEVEICGNCGVKVQFGTFTVMNSVDGMIQIPSLLKRIGKNSHDYILCCNHCGKYFIANSNIVLTDEEVKECDKLWEEYDNKMWKNTKINS